LGGAASGPDRPDRLQVKLDREEYQAGSIARVFISPPFSGELVLVVAGKELEIIPAGKITRDGKIVEIPIKSHWAAEPGVYVMPIVFRPGETAVERQPGRAVGVAWMKMNTSNRKLNVSLNSRDEVRPGQTLTINVNSASPGSETFVTLAAVDDAVLGLTGYETPDPFSHFFAQRWLAYEVRDTYGYLINPTGAERAVVRSGGDEAAARLDRGLSARSSKVVSLFSGIVRTDGEGKAEISFAAPQFSGRLRLMAVAWNARQMGHAESTVQVRDPVVSDLVLPRFLAPGDRAFATATFTNVSGVVGTYQVTFASNGPVMLDGESSWSFELGAKDTFSVDVPLVGSGVGVAGISMRVKGPIAFEVEKNWDLAVRPTQPVTARKQFVRLGKGEEKNLTASLVRSYLEGTEAVTLSIGSIPSFGVQALVDGLRVYPYRCLEQTTSRGMAFLFGTGRYPAEGTLKNFPMNSCGNWTRPSAGWRRFSAATVVSVCGRHRDAGRNGCRHTPPISWCARAKRVSACRTACSIMPWDGCGPVCGAGTSVEPKAFPPPHMPITSWPGPTEEIRVSFGIFSIPTNIISHRPWNPPLSRPRWLHTETPFAPNRPVRRCWTGLAARWTGPTPGMITIQVRRDRSRRFCILPPRRTGKMRNSARWRPASRSGSRPRNTSAHRNPPGFPWPPIPSNAGPGTTASKPMAGSGPVPPRPGCG